MNEKQKDLILLAFNDMQVIYGKTFIQKLFYIIKRQIKGLDIFEYYPYNYGPFSKELNQAINDLIEEGYIQEKRKGKYFLYQITDDGMKAAKKQKTIRSVEKNNVLKICQHVKKFTPREILEYVYKKYPQTTIRSLLKNNTA